MNSGLFLFSLLFIIKYIYVYIVNATDPYNMKILDNVKLTGSALHGRVI